MKPKILCIAFALLFLVQIAVPVRMILLSEDASNTGAELKFGCDFYDPKDLFRGNYLRLRFSTLAAEYSAPIPGLKDAPGKKFNTRLNAETYVAFKTGADGFAVPFFYSAEESKMAGGAYLLSKRLSYNPQNNKVEFYEFGFEKFFCK